MTRKRNLNPHDPLIPLKIWIPRAVVLGDFLQKLRDRRQVLIDSLSLPKGWTLRQQRCRTGCAACPHLTLSVKGKKGRPLALARAELSRKYKNISHLIEVQWNMDHYAGLINARIRVLTKGMPSTPRPEGPFTPIPYHLFAWKLIESNKKVVALQREVVDWNTENNRAAQGQITRQGGLGFMVKHLASGAFKPYWAIWIRGNMGQWFCVRTATPTFGKGYADPQHACPIPVRLTADACNRTGNWKHKPYYLSMENARSGLVKTIEHLGSNTRFLTQLHHSVASRKSF
ncbi:hypothetical protein BBC27_01840 [Acidithiobacillus ferrivorans]|uniref:Uncharacterized protein n=1 Tax=Acidithiobacillus ferrivorans TaxID=160808 RepID=A0A1B9BVY2_9PROT|nr:hypothetical protein [Acidithiobacillus ferrivorans]OCB01823.1 hypothetical protein BBC27_01840 [Acidithiobacillus ferrivorans]